MQLACEKNKYNNSRSIFHFLNLPKCESVLINTIKQSRKVLREQNGWQCFEYLSFSEEQQYFYSQNNNECGERKKIFTILSVNIWRKNQSANFFTSYFLITPINAIRIIVFLIKNYILNNDIDTTSCTTFHYLHFKTHKII